MRTMNQKAGLKKSFTLVELIVSLAVFSILLTVMLQFFTGAQKLWTSSESRNQLYSDARVAMDLMSTMLQNAYYAQNAAPIVINHAKATDTSGKSSLYFGTKAKIDLGGKTDIRFITFQRGENPNQLNKNIVNTQAQDCALLLAVLNDNEEKKYNDSFPPFSSAYGLNDVIKNVIDFLNAEAGKANSKYRYQLLENVTGLQITPYRLCSSAPGFESIPDAKLESKFGMTDAYFDMPYLVEIRLSLMDTKNFDLWKEMDASSDAAKKFKREHEYTFTRSVFLDDRHGFDD